MMIIALILACVLAASHCHGVIAPGSSMAYGAPLGYGAWDPYSAYPAQPAIASQSQNIFRSPFNLGQISTYSKAIDTPFSSVRKADIRVNNPGFAVASPFISHYGSPYVSHVGSPYVSHVGVASPVAKVATTGGLLGVAYSAAPAVSHMSYSNGLGLAYSW